jgi:NAD(P) transhydrogenase
MHSYDFIVIGSGPAGPRAAVLAAKLKRRVAVIEKMALLAADVCIVELSPAKPYGKPYCI